MKRLIISFATLACLILVPLEAVTLSASAGPPSVYIVNDNGYLGLDSDGRIHYTISNDGLRIYNVASYGYCGHHHRCHTCRYVAPNHYKHSKKAYKKAKKEYKRSKKKYKKAKKEYRKHYNRHHRHHDDD